MWSPTTLSATGTQTSYVLALHMGSLSPAQRVVAAEKLVEDIKTHDGTFDYCNFPRHALLLMIELSNSGHKRTSRYKAAAAEHIPFLGMHALDHGATTVGERWSRDQMMG